MKKIFSLALALIFFEMAAFSQTVIPVGDELILPQYAYFGGTSVGVAHRMPFVCRLKLTGLTASTTYRYMTGMSSINNLATQAPGNMYRINNASGTFGFVTGFAVTKAINSTELNNDEMRTDATSRHGRFTTDASGNYTGWFASVPTNSTGQSNGSDVYMYLNLNAGGASTTLTQSYRTTSTVKLLNYSSVPGNAAGCTALLGTSDVGAEKMVTIYDNTAGTGRPLYCTFTENNNSGGALNEATLWTNPNIYGFVDGVNGSWAAIVPNSLSGGVKAINFLDIATGNAITLSNSPKPNTSNNGSWNGISTANPAGDSTVPIKINSIASEEFYPITSNTDLSLLSNWTTDVNGGVGTAPTSFTAAYQIFIVNRAGTVLNPLTISGGSNLLVTTSDTLKFGPLSSFTIGTGSSANFGSRPVTFKSTSAGTARLAAIAGTLTNATNVTVERYISGIGKFGNAGANNRAYRMLAPSVTTASTINANWQEGQTNAAIGSNTNTKPGNGTQITGAGGAANGFDPTATNQSSLFTYNAVTPAWVAAPNTNVATLDGKTGYLLFIRGDRSIDMTSVANPLPASNTTLRTTGTLLTGTQNFTGLQGSSAFNLITNPFASPIYWGSLYAANSTNFTNAYTFWDPNQGTRGTFVTVDATGITSAGDATRDIQSGQAFFVQATATAGPLTFTISESDKSTPSNIDVFRTGPMELFRTSLYFNDANGRILADGVVNAYDNNYAAALDENDALQIANWDEDIAIVRSGSLLSIEKRPLIDNADTIFLQIARLKQQAYEWQFNPSNFNAPNMQAYLLDNFLASETAISLSDATIIGFTVTANTASSAADRFRIVFRTTAILPVNITSIKATDKQSHILLEWNTLTESGMDKFEVEKSADGRQFKPVASVVAKGNSSTLTSYNWVDVNRLASANYYRLRSVGKNGHATTSAVIKVNVGKANESLSLFPNPVKGNVITVQLNNLTKGQYALTITNKLGQQVLVQTVKHTGGTASQTINLPAAMHAGIYQLEVSGSDVKYNQQIIKY